MIRGKWLPAIAGATLMLGVAACEYVPPEEEDAGNETAKAGDESLIDTLGGMDGLSTANGLIVAAGLEPALEGPVAYTLFLPTDAAFAALPEEKLAQLRSEEGRPELIALLRMHIVPGALAKDDVIAAIRANRGSAELADTAGGTLTLRQDGKRIRIGQGEAAPMLTGDVSVASNGTVYAIDRLIAPDEPEAN